MSGDDMDQLLGPVKEEKDSENDTPEPTHTTHPVRSKSRLGFSKQMVIPLQVASHRGHITGYQSSRNLLDTNHPRNLLDDQGHLTGYQSKEGDPSKDWIIFKLMTESPVKLTRVVVKNGRTNMALKSMVVSLGFGDPEGPWTKLIEVQRLRLDKEQDFKFKEMGGALIEDAVLKQKAFSHIKLEMPRNHGSKQFNAFFSIKLFGRAFLD